MGPALRRDDGLGVGRKYLAHLGAGQQGRPYALRTLLTAHRMRGHDGDARAMALALAADYPLTEHALVGLAQEVEIAPGANDVPAAQAALATMEADHPDELLTETTRAYFVLVAGEGALPARTAARVVVASVDTPNALAGAEVGGFVLYAAYPNPFNPQAVVPFSVATAAHVRITAFDLLGREVAMLAEGRYEAGVYEAVLDGSDLPSGMYLVRANVTPENGGAAGAFTRRITLLK